MASHHFIRRCGLVGAFATAIVAAPAAGHAMLAPGNAVISVAMCADGETEDLFTDNCVPELTPITSGGNKFTPPPVYSPDEGQMTESDPGDPESLPEVDGVPCGGRHLGSCIGLEESAAGEQFVEPHSSLSASP
jgi:hypothetical protein